MVCCVMYYYSFFLFRLKIFNFRSSSGRFPMVLFSIIKFTIKYFIRYLLHYIMKWIYKCLNKIVKLRSPLICIVRSYKLKYLISFKLPTTNIQMLMDWIDDKVDIKNKVHLKSFGQSEIDLKFEIFTRVSCNQVTTSKTLAALLLLVWHFRQRFSAIFLLNTHLLINS